MQPDALNRIALMLGRALIEREMARDHVAALEQKLKVAEAVAKLDEEPSDGVPD